MANSHTPDTEIAHELDEHFEQNVVDGAGDVEFPDADLFVSEWEDDADEVVDQFDNVEIVGRIPNPIGPGDGVYFSVDE